MEESKRFSYRPNDVLDYIASSGDITFGDLAKRFNYTQMETAGVFFDLYDLGFISHSMTPPNEKGRLFGIFKLTPYGRERMKEDIGVIEYTAGLVREFSPLALDFLSTYANRSMRLPDGLSDSERVRLAEKVAREAYTVEQLKELDDELRGIG